MPGMRSSADLPFTQFSQEDSDFGCAVLQGLQLSLLTAHPSMLSEDLWTH